MTAATLAEEAWTQEDSGVKDDPRTYVTFVLAEQLLAVDVAMVREILDMQTITRLPNAPGDLLGMIDIRGENVALVDLPGRLGLHGGKSEGAGRIIVLEFGTNPATPIGVIADRVLGVAEIPDDEIGAAPSAMTSWDASVLRGVARVNGQLIQILALETVFQTNLPGAFDFE
ncbi:hypothetical protein EEB11_16315 [Pseudotabrizicola sediminis]|uniref:CheW-like domain-containing protein n=1 Tax=Pseudotabrizicola sediminis TaxID=2486418 RepID=A0ABY2KJG7_9RHOB|nr:chemotaxis protein CheW [Pseudotabrizicola sediminis]TGD41918.1 hypothetical protein EEB11_16315 [Pseudotabrizicola sediminis]